MKFLFLKSNYLIFLAVLHTVVVDANRAWGGGNRWRQGGGNSHSWRQQNYQSKYGHNYGHNNHGNSNYFNNGDGHHSNFNQEDGATEYSNVQPNTGLQPPPSKQQDSSLEDALVSFSQIPFQTSCTKPSMGGSAMFELRCILPDTGEDNDCTIRRGILPEGTTAVLKCKAPYYNEKGDARIWICEDGAWKGEFKTFSCSFGPVPVNNPNHKPTFITNDKQTPTSTNNQKPSFNNNNNNQFNKFNHTQVSNQKPTWDKNTFYNKYNQTAPITNQNQKPKPTTTDNNSNNNGNNFKPPYSWNSQTNNHTAEQPVKPKVTEKPVTSSAIDSLFSDLLDQGNDTLEDVEEWSSSLWKQPTSRPVAKPEAPKTEQPSWESQSGGWSGWTPPTTTPTTTTTTTTTTPRPSVLPPVPSGGDDWSTLYSQYSPNSTNATQGRKCPSLSKRTGVQLECLSKSAVPWDPASFLVSQTDCKTPQVVGTEATYKCQQYFEASAGLTIQYRKCKEDGTWTGGENNGFSCALECGKANPVGKIPLITSGEPTYKAQWPWHTALFYRDIREDPTQHAFICGGTLVSKRAILTAAHCVTEYFSNSLKSLTEFRIDLGRYERTIEDEFVQTFTAETIIPHPSYNPYIFDSDIAIIILKSTVTIGFHVRPICYPQTQNSAFEDLHLSDGSVGTVVGFGKNENDKLSDILHMARLKVVNQHDCAESFADTASGSSLTKSTTFCAGLKNGTNVCSGDSGGGIYFPINTGTSSRWYLQGLVSVGIGSQDGTKRCDPTRYSIFTRISPYADWIVRILSENDAL
ncbi:unnamed protein product [Orchesella dallaii]|uniref:Peptidase S1 domain-containing protein n=1 Tax=Orchesella dallaii TaxID=48710 RepID=A0ABP1Q589_9HEXA